MFSNARAALTYRQESPAKKHFRRKQREIILFVLSCRVFRLQIGLCKEKKRKLKTVGVSMKPRNYVKIPFPPKDTRIFTFHSTVYITLFTFVFSLGTQLSISVFACTDNLKVLNECVQKAISRCPHFAT